MQPITFLLLSSILMVISACTMKPHPAAMSAAELMVLVPAGWFVMGGDDARRSNRPRRDIDIDTFAIDKILAANDGQRRYGDDASIY